MRFLILICGLFWMLESNIAYGQRSKQSYKSDSTWYRYEQSCDGETVKVLDVGIIDANFPGGDSAMQAFINLHKTQNIKKTNGGGPYYLNISFIITKRGKIEKILAKDPYGYCQDCAKDAKRIIKMMPNWEPAYQLKKKAVAKFA